MEKNANIHLYTYSYACKCVPGTHFMQLSSKKNNLKIGKAENGKKH